MRIFTTSLILTALLGLTACEPTGPSADIGDKIDQVIDDSSASESIAPSEPTFDNADAVPTREAARPKPEVIEQQKEQLEQTNQTVADEADERLHEILEDTLNEP